MKMYRNIKNILKLKIDITFIITYLKDIKKIKIIYLVIYTKISLSKKNKK